MRSAITLRGLLGTAAFGLYLAPLNVNAQGYPSHSITVVVPFPAGGPSDVVARIVTEHMGRTLGHLLVTENVGGAGGTLGSARVAASAPDGYTLLAGSMGSHVAAPVLTPNLKYDPSRDFEPIGFTAHSPAVIAARKEFPAKDIAEFVAYLRQNGDKVKQAHGGIGASSHMACLLFTSELGLKPTRTIKGYVVSASKRLAALPNIPTAKEARIKFDMSIWAGIFAPKGVSKEVVDKLAAAPDKALDDPSVEKRLGNWGHRFPSRRKETPRPLVA
jgi:tripartite-type tricarboxylate transporter receptor subunit TctC